MKFWMIVNIVSRENAEFYHCEAERVHRPPTMMYPYKEDAEEELLRLSKKHPDGEFYLLESAAFTTSADSECGRVCRIEEIKRSHPTGLISQ